MSAASPPSTTAAHADQSPAMDAHSEDAAQGDATQVSDACAAPNPPRAFTRPPALSQDAPEDDTMDDEGSGDALPPALPDMSEENTQDGGREPHRTADPRFESESYAPRAEISNILDLLRQARKPSYARRYRIALAAHAPVPPRVSAPNGRSQSEDVPVPGSSPMGSPAYGSGFEIRAYGGGAPAGLYGGPGWSAASASVRPPLSPNSALPSASTQHAPTHNSLGLHIQPYAAAAAETGQPSPAKKLPRLILHGPRRPPDYVSPTESQKQRRWEAMNQDTTSGASSGGARSEDDDDEDDEAGSSSDDRYGSGKKSLATQPQVSTTGEFKCERDGCTNVYVQLGELLRHQRTSIFHSERKFVCECGNSYARQDGLKRHKISAGHTTPSKALRGTSGRGRGSWRTRRTSSMSLVSPHSPEVVTKPQPPVSPFASVFSRGPRGAGKHECEKCSSRFQDSIALEAHQSLCYFTTDVEPARVESTDGRDANMDVDGDSPHSVAPSKRVPALSSQSDVLQPIQLPMLNHELLTSA
ncbi:hypothetical protein EXIGLDRAFT_34678 [Exidia glandulosa HHB12029]|uniref:C2H2-type domain-containing protein n=1 Tax=Exidia glandulosa HHB12029 TaxID=1314781 RepID=A0A165IQS6_EXIGL|nr:hypothetical protein EXIGLDRAFT_34678 [Exidia glandulosa HHB12029]